LLVACVPGLLMLAALGLGRLENEIARGPVVAVRTEAFVERPEPVAISALAREGMPEALEYLHRRQAQLLLDPPPYGRHAAPHYAVPVFAGNFTAREEVGLPTRIHAHSHINPQFSQTRYVNRV
jgi:hypothetical protein